VGAEWRHATHPHLDSGLEVVHVDLTQVLAVPFVEDTAEEVSSVVGFHAPVIDDRTWGAGLCLGSAEHRHEPLVPVLWSDLPEPDGLHDGSELNSLRADPVAQKAVDLNGVLCVQPIHAAKSRKVHLHS